MSAGECQTSNRGDYEDVSGLFALKSDREPKPRGVQDPFREVFLV